MSGVRVQVGGYSVQLWRGEPPAALDMMLRGASLADNFLSEVAPDDAEFFGVSVAENGAGSVSADVFVVQRFSPSVPGFEPGVLIVPETGVAFIGAGERLLAYDLARPARLWEDSADVGFWWWDRVGGVILMAAELELAAWNLEGRKLWTTFVEPPWSYWVDGGTLELDVMGNLHRFSLLTGPLYTGPAPQS